MATAHNDCLDSGLDRLVRLRRELAHESDAESLFRAAFRFGVCEWCGCQVEDEHYSDCELIFNPRDPTGEGELHNQRLCSADRSSVERLHRGFDKP